MQSKPQYKRPTKLEASTSNDLTVEIFRKAYEEQLLNEKPSIMTRHFAMKRINALNTVEEILAHAKEHPSGRTQQVINNWVSTHKANSNKDSLSVNPYYTPNNSSVFWSKAIPVAEQKNMLAQFLACSMGELECLQSRSDTGSVWKYKDNVYKVFSKGTNNRSALEQAEFEQTGWNNFYRNMSLYQYATAINTELDQQLGLMVTPYLQGTKPSNDQLSELELSIVKKMSATLDDLYKDGNCLVLPNHKVVIVDFGEWNELKSNEKSRRISDLQMELNMTSNRFNDSMGYDYHSVMW